LRNWDEVYKNQKIILQTLEEIDDIFLAGGRLFNVIFYLIDTENQKIWTFLALTLSEMPMK